MELIKKGALKPNDASVSKSRLSGVICADKCFPPVLVKLCKITP